ncbi:MAG: hypothetical protein ACRDPY_00005, partial [Streptosporangiaceae bacterium]
PRLAALAILHASDGHASRSGTQPRALVTAPAHAADLIDQLRAAGVSLIYDPATKTLHADTNAAAVAVG